MLFREIIAAYSKNRMKPIKNTYLHNVKIAGTYNYHALKGGGKRNEVISLK
jgi:hypothetical protein